MSEQSPLPLANGRLRQYAEHPLGKLAERIAVGLLTFLAIWQFNTLENVRAELARLRGDQQAVLVRLERAERDIQSLEEARWRRP